MTDESEVLLDATTALVPPLLAALDVLAFAGRHLHPPLLPQIAEMVADYDGAAARRPGAVRLGAMAGRSAVFPFSADARPATQH